jgi:hypothetical protein
VSVLPDRDFRQPLMLSCSSALPNGYACEFAPAFLAASGNSMLLVLTGSERASMRRIPAPWSGTLLAFGCILLLATAKNRHSRITVVFFGCFLVIFFTGCRNSARSSHATQAVVLTVQASTAIEAQAIIHSVQVAVRLPAGK